MEVIYWEKFVIYFVVAVAVGVYGEFLEDMPKSKIKIVNIINRDYWAIVFSGLGAFFIGGAASTFGLEFDTLGAWFLYLIIWWMLYLYVKKQDELGWPVTYDNENEKRK